MKRDELRHCDLVVLRDGSLGIIIERDEVAFIAYEKMGYDEIDMHYDEDLKEMYDGPEYDIMQVYRADYGIVSFATYEDDGFMIFERDATWERPSEEERAEIERKRREAWEQQAAKEEERRKQAGKNLITVMAQAFYGNRVITETRPEKIDELVLGWIDKMPAGLEKIDRSVLHIPGPDQVVLIYNKYREEKERTRLESRLRESGRPQKPLASIPEEGIELYSRCIACRMDEQGNLQSLQDEDYEVLIKYLAE